MSILSSPEARALVRQAFSVGRRNWRPLLATDLAWKLVAFALLAPLVGVALRAGLLLSGEPVLADQEILLFALRPAGFTLLVAVAALSLAIVGLEQASLMGIAAGGSTGVRVTAARSLRWVSRRALPVVALSLRLVARSLLLGFPFVAGIGAVYLLLLRKYDINFYLREKPPVFLVAVGLVVLLAVGLVRVLVPRIVGWLLALPLVLFEGILPRHALAESERRVAGDRGLATRLLLLWGAGALLVSLGLPPLLFAMARSLVPFGRNHLPLTLSLLLVVGVLWGLVNVLVSWANASVFALMLVELFRHCGGRVDTGLPGLAAEEAGVDAARSRFRLRAALAGAALLAVASGGLGIWLFLGVRGNDGALVFGHRGAAAAAPENTMAAIEAGLAQKADFVEIDVQESADGEVVVTHDSDFMRQAHDPLKVWNATRSDLDRIDIGSWFSPRYAAERVPTLRDVLARVRGRGRVNIELKTYGHGVRLEERVVDEVEAMGMAGDVVLMSLDDRIVRKLRQLRPGWTLGLLTSKAVGDLAKVDADFLAVRAGLASRGFVRHAHARGKKVHVWTVNDPVRMFQVLNLGVDGIITDRPGLAKEVLARRAAMSSAERLLVGLAFYFGAAEPDFPSSNDGS